MSSIVSAGSALLFGPGALARSLGAQQLSGRAPETPSLSRVEPTARAEARSRLDEASARELSETARSRFTADYDYGLQLAGGRDRLFAPTIPAEPDGLIGAALDTLG